MDPAILVHYAAKIIKCFDDDILSVRRAAVKTLARLPPHDLELHLEALVRKLRDPEWTVRAAIVEAVGTLSPSIVTGSSCFTPMLDAVEDAFDGVRSAAVGVLGALPPKLLATHGAAIASLVQHRRGAVRVAAISILDSLDAEDIAGHVAALGKRIEQPNPDSNPFVRASALHVLSRLNEAQLQPYQQSILRLIEDEDDAVKSAAFDALAAADPTGALTEKAGSPNRASLGGPNSPTQRRGLAAQMAKSSSVVVAPSTLSPNPSVTFGSGDGKEIASFNRSKGASKKSSERLAAVMQRLPAQEPFRNAPSLSRSHDPATVLRGTPRG